MVIDPSTTVGKLRLRVGDWRDLEILPDSVYEQTYADCDENLNRAAAICAQYILCSLSFGVRSKMYQLESYDNQAFEQYKQFLMLTINNPAFMPYSPIPFGGGSGDVSPLVQFQKSWNAGYFKGTSEQEMYEYYQGTVASEGEEDE
jgi:hypothetical protein